MQALLPSTYLGNIACYSVMVKSDSVVTEIFDSYHRQTFRNRAEILGPNGREILTVPVIKPQEKSLVKDIEIDGTSWQTQHLRAIQTAYNSSPFMEYYIDYLMPFYTKPFRYLYDLNEQLRQTITHLIGLDVSHSFSGEYVKEAENDFRFLVEKKAPLPDGFNQEPYYQTFENKFGFIPNLSIIDLLFNLGPETIIQLHN